MNHLYRFGIAIGLVSFASLALAVPDLTGAWNGKFAYDYSKLPTSLTADQKKSVIEMSKKRTQSTVKLTLRANHTFTMVASGVGAKAQPVTGKWGQDAKTLTLQPVKNGMKDAMVTFNLQNQGKSMSFTNGPLTMTFTR